MQQGRLAHILIKHSKEEADYGSSILNGVAGTRGRGRGLLVSYFYPMTV